MNAPGAIAVLVQRPGSSRPGMPLGAMYRPGTRVPSSASSVGAGAGAGAATGAGAGAGGAPSSSLLRTRGASADIVLVVCARARAFSPSPLTRGRSRTLYGARQLNGRRAAPRRARHAARGRTPLFSKRKTPPQTTQAHRTDSSAHSPRGARCRSRARPTRPARPATACSARRRSAAGEKEGRAQHQRVVPLVSDGVDEGDAALPRRRLQQRVRP